MTTPDAAGLGARLALARSLEDAGLGPEAIGIVNAHGSGTPLNDATEAKAFDAVFGAVSPPPVVFATKGNFGHSLGATGILEAIAVMLALRTGEVPPIFGLSQPYPELHFPLPRGAPLRHGARFGLSVTLGFGGFDTSLVFERARDERSSAAPKPWLAGARPRRRRSPRASRFRRRRSSRGFATPIPPPG